MTFPQTRTGHWPVKLTSVWPYLSVKQRFPLQSSGANSALVVSFQTTPSPVSAFWVSFFPSLCFSPFAVCLFCLLCSMWAVSDASKLVKPESEAHTAQCLHRKLCAENLLWLSCSDTYITVCIFLCTLSQVAKQLSKCVRFPLTVMSCHCAQPHLHACLHVCLLVHQSVHCFHNLCGSVCDPRLECHTDLYPLTPLLVTHWIPSWWMSGCTKHWTCFCCRELVFVYEVDDGKFSVVGVLLKYKTKAVVVVPRLWNSLTTHIRSASTALNNVWKCACTDRTCIDIFVPTHRAETTSLLFL